VLEYLKIVEFVKITKMKLKIIKPNKEKGWWYEDCIGEEFEITDFAYYNGGANHPLETPKNLKELKEYVEKYGKNLHMHTSRDPNGSYYGSVKGGGPFWEIHLENTNWKILERKEKLLKLQEYE
jgi:hypothetical protein